MKHSVSLIGAGLAGSLLATYFAKRGIQVDLYERRLDMRKVKISAGRSINLALSTRGIHALKEVGAYEAIAKHAIPMRGRMLHAPDCTLSFQPYGKDENEFINSISRADLNIELMNLAEATGNVKIHFEERCVGGNPTTGEIYFENEVTKSRKNLSSFPVIGTDGSASALRTAMFDAGLADCRQDLLAHGYKELTIPPAENGEHQMETHALHIWPRKTFMLIALPNPDGSFTCTLFLALTGSESFQSLQSPDDVVLFFKKYFSDAYLMMPTLTDDFFENPTGTMVTVRTAPWSIEGRWALLGDAAHAIVPFFGQGMNCAFEDCTVLNECLELLPREGWRGVFERYFELRKRNAEAIADLALENFIEMRDRVADPKFLLRKKVEHKLEECFSDRFIPKYSMVTFHRVPYSLAQRRGVIQDEILDQLCESLTNLEDLDLAEARRLIENRVVPMSQEI